MSLAARAFMDENERTLSENPFNRKSVIISESEAKAKKEKAEKKESAKKTEEGDAEQDKAETEKTETDKTENE